VIVSFVLTASELRPVLFTVRATFSRGRSPVAVVQENGLALVTPLMKACPVPVQVAAE
jgi:hypothetical protein